MKNVLVVGTGTIGEPLIGLLAQHKEALGIDNIYFFKRTPLSDEKGKVEALNLLKSPKAQDVLESDFSEQAIIALEQEFNMVTVLHELNTALRETDGAVEINEDTGVATPTKKGIEVFKSRLASSSYSIKASFNISLKSIFFLFVI